MFANAALMLCSKFTAGLCFKMIFFLLQVEIPDVVADTTTDKLALLDSSLNENADDSGSDLNIPGVEELLVCVNDENKENYSF